MASIIHEAEFARLLREELNAAMLSAAEPVLQAAIKELERKMREELGKRIIALIQNDFSVERMGHDIRILVKQAAK